MTQGLMIVLAVLLYGNPLLILAIWMIRLAAPAIMQAEPRRWRSRMPWVSLILATVAVASFWFAAFQIHYPDPAPIKNMVKVAVWLSLLCALAGLATALLAKRSAKWIAIPSILVPLNWFTWAVLQ